MPLYTFACYDCNKSTDIKMTLAEHSEKKDKIHCDCGKPMIQSVARLRFKLNGVGWYDQDYGITEQETRTNLDFEKNIEDRYNTAMVKGEC